MKPVKNRIRMEYLQIGGPFGDRRNEIVIEGDGGLDHAVDAFRTFLISMGFAHETIEKEVLKGECE